MVATHDGDRRPGDPVGVPLVHVGRTDLQYAVDTNFVDDSTPGATRLRTLRSEGWVRLFRTDVVDTELGDKNDPVKRGRLLELSGEYVELFGPMRLGHSRLGHSVLGGDDDDHQFRRAFSIMFRGSDLATASQTNTGRRNVRDAMHITTAIRYGMNGFVTRNKHGLLSKAAQLRSEFDGFTVATPEQTLAVVERFMHNWEQRHRSSRAE